MVEFNFNPRAPCGARRQRLAPAAAGIVFQSTHPSRGATIYQVIYSGAKKISIHAPLAGRD